MIEIYKEEWIPMFLMSFSMIERKRFRLFTMQKKVLLQLMLC